MEVVRLLLAHGADPNIQDAAQKTPLSRAAKNVTELLLANGAKPAKPYKKADFAELRLRHHRAAERAERAQW